MRPDPLRALNYTGFKTALENSGCTRCGLAASRTQVVVDRGSPDAQILLVGEAPGASEDLEGRAFVGRSGRLLDSLLVEAGIDPERDVLIANVVKCRPPENRRPARDEAEACLPFLLKQIEFAGPRLIGLLGATALKYFVPDRKGFKMSEEAGKFFEHPGYPGAKIMVLFHPAYLLRDPRKTPLMRAHLERFRGAAAAVR